jgi:hypothetical protein
MSKLVFYDATTLSKTTFRITTISKIDRLQNSAEQNYHNFPAMQSIIMPL